MVSLKWEAFRLAPFSLLTVHLTLLMRHFIFDIVIVLLILVLGGLLFDSLRTQHVFPGLVMGQERLGRMSFDKVDDFLDTIEKRIFDDATAVAVGDTWVEAHLADMGVSLDRHKLYDRITAHGHSESVSHRLAMWVRSWVGWRSIDLEKDIVIDTSALMRFLAEQGLDEEFATAAAEGNLELVEGGIVRTDPVSGFGVDHRALRSDISAFVTDPDFEPPFELELTEIQPSVTRQELKENHERLSAYLAEPVVFTERGGGMMYMAQPEEYTNWFALEQVANDRWEFRLAPGGFEQILEILGPHDARFVIAADQTIEIEPHRPGYVFEEKAFIAELHKMMDKGEHEIRMRVLGKNDPEFLAHEAEELEIEHVIAQFTTHHPCCADRVINIQQMADVVNGAVVRPGKTFDLNEHVGERTPEKGFVPAGMLMHGEMIDSVGGGVSQFATTLYNAVYWGGLEILTHKPHSQYFPRYPEGIEATVSWKYPTLRFRNNYETPVILLASYTDSSITVTVAGQNDSRAVVGEQVNSSTQIKVKNSGGDEAREVGSYVTPRFNFQPPPTKYLAYPDRYEPGTRRVVESGKAGWDVRIIRTVTYRHVDVVDTQSWLARYVHPKIVHVADCDEVAAEIATDQKASCVTAG